MKIELEINESELENLIKQAFVNKITDRYVSDYCAERRQVDRIRQEVVREVLYKDKERIINGIIAQASRECGNKAVKRLVEAAIKE